ncbi:MAG: long-chain-fatty-acid--CoA ligase [Anaerolineae bacterium]
MADRFWTTQYDKDVPLSLAPYPQRSLTDVVADAARERPNHPALIFKGKAVPYGELHRLAQVFACSLAELGVRPGSRVALLLPNTPQMVFAVLGAWLAGCIVVPLNPLYTERELEHGLVQSGAEVAVILTPFYSKLKSIQSRTGIRTVIATNVKEYLPAAQRLLFTLFKESKDGHRITIQEGDSWLQDLIARNRSNSPSAQLARPSDTAILLFSGGTTGTPKAVMGTHQALLIAGLQIHAWLKSRVVDWDDVIMLNMPMFHAYGLVGVFATGLIGHNTFAVVPNPRDLNDVLATIQATHAAFVPGVPTFFNALLNHPKVQSKQVDLTSVKLCISGASSLLAETKHRFEAVTGGHIAEAYALTESMLGATMSPVLGVYKPGSIGIPLPDVDLRILDLDTGKKVLPPGEIGEITLCAPQVMQGYWNQPEETANVLRDGWLYTGDIGYQDEDGYVFIVDRKKDLIKPGGFQVWPRDVEEVIASHPAVAEVCVGGVPDARSGEAVKAWVVVRGGEVLSEDALRAYCHEKLAAYKVPKFIEFREVLPKSPVGKILRRELVSAEHS